VPQNLSIDNIIIGAYSKWYIQQVIIIIGAYSKWYIQQVILGAAGDQATH